MNKKVFAVVLCILLYSFSVSAQKPDPKFHIYILMGQSNMAGRGKITAELKNLSDPHVVMLNSTGQWVQAHHPVHFDKPKIAGVGPGLSFGIAIAKANPSAKIALVPCAVGGTSIDKWIPGGYDKVTNTHPYYDAVKRIQEAMKYGVVKGVIWHQGEANSSEEGSKTYLAKLTELIERVRKLVGNPDLPFVAGELGRYNAQYQNINNVLKELPGKVNHTAVASSEGLTDKGDNTHFDGPSADEFGKRFAAKMLELQLGGQQLICPIIPLPNAFENTGKNFQLDNHTAILVNNEALLPLAHYLQTELLSKFGITIIVQKKSPAPAIILELSTKNTDKPEAYQLKMDENHIKLMAGNTNGIFNGVVSLLQLVGIAPIKNNAFELACWNITDAPRYTWRGLMLDESRHFFGKDKVKSLLDWMAFYKLNKFHWHLTDMPGWRLEIKRYPKLTTVGGIGSFSNANAPARYYTQKDIAEIVAYAKERFITVIPEIDMPGHASAANRAYPEFNGGGTTKLPDFTFNPGKEETYQYLSHILKETAVLFPAGMIHIGADEVNYGNRAWETDVNVQQLQQTHKLTDRKAVEQYFIRRMADSVIKLNRKVLVWDEAADAGLDPKETVVFWWRQDKPEQLKLALDKGIPVVLCPRLPLYFDFVQDSIHRIGRKGKNGEYNGLADVYRFSHEKVPTVGDKGKLIEGIQADIWTESIPDNRRLDFMLFPRIAALAEAAWTASKQKNYEQFEQRLKHHLQLYRAAGIYYYDPFSPSKNSEPDYVNKSTTRGYID